MTPEQAEEFAGRTGVDALAVAIGSVHGMTAILVHLDLALLDRIAAVVSIPLVPHGAARARGGRGTACRRAGMAKVNFNAELRRGYLDALFSGADPESDDVVAVQRGVRSRVSSRWRPRSWRSPPAGIPTVDTNNGGL